MGDKTSCVLTTADIACCSNSTIDCDKSSIPHQSTFHASHNALDIKPPVPPRRKKPPRTNVSCSDNDISYTLSLFDNNLNFYVDKRSSGDLSAR